MRRVEGGRSGGSLALRGEVGPERLFPGADRRPKRGVLRANGRVRNRGSAGPAAISLGASSADSPTPSPEPGSSRWPMPGATAASQVQYRVGIYPRKSNAFAYTMVPEVTGNAASSARAIRCGPEYGELKPLASEESKPKRR
jgi:hypothetical protein